MLLTEDWDLVIKEVGMSPRELVSRAEAVRASYLNMEEACGLESQISYNRFGSAAMTTKEIKKNMLPRFWDWLFSYCNRDLQIAMIVFLYALREENSSRIAVDFSRVFIQNTGTRNKAKSGFPNMRTIAEAEEMLENVRNQEIIKHQKETVFDNSFCPYASLRKEGI